MRQATRPDDRWTLDDILYVGLVLIVEVAGILFTLGVFAVLLWMASS